MFWWKYCPGSINPDIRWALSVQVSILVLVEVLPWVQRPASAVSPHGEVSILVLVEVLPWALATKLSSLDSLTMSFQSLFWWKYCPGTGLRAMAMQTPQKFQSLFWWKYCPGAMCQRCHNRYDLRFNPCSGGSIALGISCLLRWQIFLVSILVLVEVLPWEMILKSPMNGRPRVSILVLVEVLPWASVLASLPT